MEFNKEHAAIMFKRGIEISDSSEQIKLISGKDATKYEIHRFVLVAASKYFATMFGSGFEDSKRSEFTLKEVDGGTIKAIVDFCYFGSIELSEENVDEFIAAASFYQFELLEQKCCQFRSAILKASNAVQTLSIADKFNLSDLRQQAFGLVCEMFDTIPSTDVQQIDYRFLEQILSSDNVQASEETIFKGLMDWYAYSKVDREKFMENLLKCIRVKHVSREFLVEKVDAACRQFNCMELVIKEYQRRVLHPASKICSHRSLQLCAVFHDESSQCIFVEKYNAALKSFEPAAEITLKNRNSFEMVLLENILIVLGGRDSHGRELKSVVPFDLVSGETEILPEMNGARVHFTAIVCDKYIYVIGGLENGTMLNSCERFDTTTKEWKQITSMNIYIFKCAATVMDSCIYVAGGYSPRGLISSVTKYDPKNDEWINLAAMTKTRQNFALANSGGFLYAMGSDHAVERYDPLKNEWTIIGSFNARHLITGAVLIEDNLFIFTAEGEFAKLQPNECGIGPLEPLCVSNYKSENPSRRKLLFTVQK